jgi:hypothetical protein
MHRQFEPIDEQRLQHRGDVVGRCAGRNRGRDVEAKLSEPVRSSDLLVPREVVVGTSARRPPWGTEARLNVKRNE